MLQCSNSRIDYFNPMNSTLLKALQAVASEDTRLKEAEKFLKTLSFPRQQRADTEVHARPDFVFRSFRVFDYFTERGGVEDDDFPEFTGKAEAEKYVKSRMPKELEGLKLSLNEQEKCWFTVTFRKG
jgi:hypothetical protein